MDGEVAWPLMEKMTDLQGIAATMVKNQQGWQRSKEQR